MGKQICPRTIPEIELEQLQLFYMHFVIFKHSVFIIHKQNDKFTNL